MTYFKSLFINFLTVFFVNHVMPNITISYHTKLPHIGGEIIFAFCLGFLNSLVFPFVRLFSAKPSYFKIGIATFIVTFGSYALVNFVPADIKLHTVGAYIWSSLVVWFFAYVTNHMEFRRFVQKRQAHKEEKPQDEEGEE